MAGAEADAKAALRARLRREIRALPSAARAIAQADVVGQVGGMLPRRGLVAGFVSVRGEIDLKALWRALGSRLVLPRVQGRELHFHVVEHLASLVEGAFGIREPLATWQEVGVEALGAVVVPGVAFDMAGNRLGQGQGYYDRALAPLADADGRVAQAIGVAFDLQVLDEVPVEPHDLRVGCVLSGRTARLGVPR